MLTTDSARTKSLSIIKCGLPTEADGMLFRALSEFAKAHLVRCKHELNQTGVFQIGRQNVVSMFRQIHNWHRMGTDPASGCSSRWNLANYHSGWMNSSLSEGQ